MYVSMLLTTHGTMYFNELSEHFVFGAQDTNLLATQQEVTLSAELAAAAAAVDGGDDDTTGATRHQMFTYRSPTDNLLVSLGRWLGAAIIFILFAKSFQALHTQYNCFEVI